MRVHLFPSRTQKLSSSAPTILGGRLPGKIGNANTETSTEMWGFFAPASVHRTLAVGATIPGLPGKICNASTETSTEMWRFFALVRVCWLWGANCSVPVCVHIYEKPDKMSGFPYFMGFGYAPLSCRTKFITSSKDIHCTWWERC